MTIMGNRKPLFVKLNEMACPRAMVNLLLVLGGLHNTHPYVKVSGESVGTDVRQLKKFWKL
jgi:hypothetical protein